MPIHVPNCLRLRPAFLAVALCGIVSCSTPPSLAAERAPKLLAKDVEYSTHRSAEGSPGPTLDLYGPATKPDSPLPIVLFVHGGVWRFGDKAMVGDKPAAFVSRGYLFASADYRLDESVSPREMGLPDDGPTRKIFNFLAGELGGE